LESESVKLKEEISKMPSFEKYEKLANEYGNLLSKYVFFTFDY